MYVCIYIYMYIHTNTHTHTHTMLTPLPTSCAVVTKSGNLNFLEPSGRVQACNGTALLFTRLSSVHGYRPNSCKTHYFTLGRLKYNATSQNPFKMSQFNEWIQAFVGWPWSLQKRRTCQTFCINSNIWWTVLGTISFLSSPFVKASLCRIWSWILLYLWQKIISSTADVFLFSWFCLGLCEKNYNKSQWRHIIKMGHLRPSSFQVLIPDLFRKFYFYFSSVFPCHICIAALKKKPIVTSYKYVP